MAQKPIDWSKVDVKPPTGVKLPKAQAIDKAIEELQDQINKTFGGGVPVQPGIGKTGNIPTSQQASSSQGKPKFNPGDKVADSKGKVYTIDSNGVVPIYTNPSGASPYGYNAVDDSGKWGFFLESELSPVVAVNFTPPQSIDFVLNLKDLDNLHLSGGPLEVEELDLSMFDKPKPCTCLSRDLFHHGCRCGHLRR